MKREKILKILNYLERNKLFTSSRSLKKVIQAFRKGEVESIFFIPTFGEPRGCDTCSRCDEKKPTRDFSYYQARVSENGFLSRSNALCSICSKKIDRDRKNILKKEENKIPPTPKKGSKCPRCKRVWNGRWHRDHSEKTKRFNRWICGNCNMSKGDQRNPHLVMDE